MIIVKTTNGDRFINEAECLQVNHLRDIATVEVWPVRWGENRQQAMPQYYIIKNVEAVIYTTSPKDWHDEGSAIKKLEEKIADQQKLITHLSNVRTDLIDTVDRYRSKLRDFGCEL